MIKLSHSSITKYLDCPRAYKYHYIDKYVSKFKSSALFFGTSVDLAIGNLLTDMLEVKPDGFVKRDPYTLFDETWSKQEHNGDMIDLKESTILRYSNADFDHELLKPEDGITSIELDRYDVIKEKKAKVGYNNLKEDDLIFHNRVNWLAMRRKGHLMIKAFISDFLPRIVKVHEVQKEIRLEDTDSYIMGFLDMVISVDTLDNIVVADLKTSARDYEDDAILKSQQLSIYCEAMQIYNAAFIVLKKQITKIRKKTCSVCGFKAPSGSRFKTCDAEVKGKRCGGEWNETLYMKAQIQYLNDAISTQQTDLYLNNSLDVAKGIIAGVFPRRFESCLKGYGPCEFQSICLKNQDDGTLCKSAPKPVDNTEKK